MVSRVVRLKRNVISLNVNLMRFKYEETVFRYFYEITRRTTQILWLKATLKDLVGIFVEKKIYFILKAKWVTI